MDAAMLYALRDPAGVPSHPIIFLLLGVLTWALHIAAVQVMLGASVLTLFGAFQQNPHWRRLATAMLATAKASLVFMDTSLPPDSGTYPLAPPRVRTHLDGLADDEGLLLPWTRWWPRDAYDDVIPADQFDDVDRDCPRVPLAYFDTHLTAPDGWTSSRNAYLAFGGTYADELARARDHRWPHATLDGGHLQFLVEPDAVADAILALVAELSDR